MWHQLKLGVWRGCRRYRGLFEDNRGRQDNRGEDDEEVGARNDGRGLGQMNPFKKLQWLLVSAAPFGRQGGDGSEADGGKARSRSQRKTNSHIEVFVSEAKGDENFQSRKIPKFF